MTATPAPRSSLAPWACWLSGAASLLALTSCGLRWNVLLLACVALAVVAVGLALVAWRRAASPTWQLFSVGAAPLLCMMVIPASEDFAETSLRTQTKNSAKIIGLAVYGHQDQQRALPPASIRDEQGKPLYSWRLKIMPFLESSLVYQKFHKNEPWDSPANLPFLHQMSFAYYTTIPINYATPLTGEHTETPWQVFVGPGTAFDPEKKISLKNDFPDGLAHTLLFVEAADLVPWTKPQDLPYQADAPLPKLGRVYAKREPLPWSGPHQPTGFFAAMADGSVRYVNAKVSEKVLRRVIVRNDGKPVADDWHQ